MANTSILRPAELLELCVQEQASDLHIAAGHAPILRISGRLVPLVKHPLVTKEGAQSFCFSLMTKEQQERFVKNKDIDFSYSFESKGRFRVNVFLQQQTISCALRLIPSKIQTIEELNLPSVLSEFTKHSQGFVLVTGPSGHGKSTTLAALIDQINHERAEHIVTIEDTI